MLGKHKILCIIPARGDSKSIINKNTKPFMDKMLFEWSILAAMNSSYIDKILVSSNMGDIKERIEAIKEELSQCDADKLEYLQRPDKLCGDLCSTEEALIHATEYAQDFCDLVPEYIMTLQPTSPIRTDNIVDKALEKIDTENSDSLLSVSKHSPFFFSHKMSDDGDGFLRDYKGRYIVESKFDYKNRPMRQKIKQWFYHDSGSIYVSRRKILMTENCRLGGYISFFITDKFQSMQLDDNYDWLLMENVCKIKGGPI